MKRAILEVNGVFMAMMTLSHINHLGANPTKWPNTLKQFVGKLSTNCLSVFGHFDNLALKGLSYSEV